MTTPTTTTTTTTATTTIYNIDALMLLSDCYETVVTWQKYWVQLWAISACMTDRLRNNVIYSLNSTKKL